MTVRFNIPAPVGNEETYLTEAIRSGQLGGTGPFAHRCEALLSDHFGAPVLLTTSATSALEMAAMLLELGPGDEVVMPSFTFVSSANAVMLRGAAPVFGDIDPATLNLAPEGVAARVGPRTRSVWPIHYGGIGADMGAISEAAGAAICVEDAAQGLGAHRGGRPLGSVAPLAALSFHESKNIQCGEGGALIVNDPAYLDRAHLLRDKGTDRRRFLEGAVDKYSWQDIGSSYALSELSAAYLLGQLEQIGRITDRRRAIWDRYAARLAPLRAAGQADWLAPPPECHGNGHVFPLLLPRATDRPAFIAQMASEGIQAFFHYVPLHLSPMGEKLGYRPGDLPVTEDLAARLVRLPLHTSLTETQADQVADVVLRFFGVAP